MKKIRWQFFLSAVAGLCLVCSTAAFAGCKETPSDSSGDSTSSEESVGNITLNTSEIELDLYESYQLTAETGSSAAVSWSSSDEGVATVENGLVKAVSEGISTITAEAGGATAYCTVTVINSHTAPVLSLSETDIGVSPDGEVTIDASVQYKGNPVTDEIEYTWALAEGAETGVAEIEADGASCKIKGVGFGKTTITVSAVVYGIPLSASAAVNCANDKVVFTVDGLELGTVGYAVDLVLVTAEGLDKELAPDMTVTENGSEVDLSEVEWSSADETIAIVKDGGVITAVSLGSTLVKAEYNGNGMYFEVNVTAAEIVADSVFAIEYDKDGKFALTDEIEGKVTSVSVDNTEILLSFDEEKRIVETDCSLINGYGEKEIVLLTDLAKYTATAEVYTMIIRTADDLDRMQSVADELAEDPASGYAAMDGYFVLGNDIDYVNEDGSERVYTSLENCYIADWSAPFKGTFDGRGYNIDHFQTGFVSHNAGSGLFPVLTGTIKNVSFTNAIHGGKHGFVTSALGGTIENVYVHLLDQKEYGTTWSQASAVFFTYANLGTAKVVSCFTKIDKCDENTWPIACFTAHADHLQGVYSVGGNYETPVWIYGGTAAQSAYGGYKDYNAFIAADNDLSGWSEEFWQIVDGLPYPKNLEFAPYELSVDQTEEVFETGKPFSPPAGTLFNYLTGEPKDDAAVTVKVTFGGKEIPLENGKINASSAGKYTLEYTATYEGKTYSKISEILVYGTELAVFDNAGALDSVKNVEGDTFRFVDAAAIAADDTLVPLDGSDKGYAMVTNSKAQAWYNIRVIPQCTLDTFLAADCIDFRMYIKSIHSSPVTMYFYNTVIAQVPVNTWTTVRMPYSAFYTPAKQGFYTTLDKHYELMGTTGNLFMLVGAANERDYTLCISSIKFGTIPPSDPELGDKYTKLGTDTVFSKNGTVSMDTFEGKSVVKIVSTNAWEEVYVTPQKTFEELENCKVVFRIYVQKAGADGQDCVAYAQPNARTGKNEPTFYDTFKYNTWAELKMDYELLKDMYFNMSTRTLNPANSAAFIFQNKAFDALYIESVTVVSETAE